MRMNPSRGEPASQLIARLSEARLASLLTENADEPHAELIRPFS
jgi:16S rRNA (cytosine1402-N4)-methyltransferase